MATAVKTPSAGMTGAVRSLQWTIQDMNGSVEHLGQSHDHLRRAQNIMAWTTAIFGALLLSGLVWIANDIFHLKDQLMETDRRFDGMDAQMTALGTRIDDLNITIEQLGAELLAGGRTPDAPVTGPDVSVLSTPTAPENLQTAANAPLESTVPDAAAQPQPVIQPQAPAAPQIQPQGQPAQPQQPVAQPQQQAALAPAQPVVPAQPAAEAAPRQPIPAFAPSPPAPRDQLTPAELAGPAPVLAAAAPAAAPAAPAAAPAAEAPGAEQTQVAEAPAAEAAPAPAAPAANLSDDELLSFNDDQIDPADELLLLDENGNPQ